MKLIFKYYNYNYNYSKIMTDLTEQIINILETSIILMEHSRQKMISPRTIKAAFEIIYKQNKELCKQGVIEATKYITIECANIECTNNNLKIQRKNYKFCDNLLKKFCKEKQVKKRAYTSIYLNGLIDILEKYKG